MTKRPKKLLDQVRDAIRLKHYSIRTEEAAYLRQVRELDQTLHPVPRPTPPQRDGPL